MSCLTSDSMTILDFRRLTQLSSDIGEDAGRLVQVNNAKRSTHLGRSCLRPNDGQSGEAHTESDLTRYYGFCGKMSNLL